MVQGDPANDNAAPVFDDAQRERTRAAIERLYSDDRFHRNVCGLLGWVGRKKDLSSLQVGADDEDFRSACDVVYRRIMDGPIGPVLDRLSDQAIEDLIICMAGFGPVVWGAVAEARQKKRAALRKRNVTSTSGNEGEANE